MRRFFIPPEQIGQNEPSIYGPDAHHLRVVLRLGPGDMIIVFDGSGNEYQARVVSTDRERVKVNLVAPLVNQTESYLDLVLAQGYLKDKKMDLLVRQLTELGVTQWIPFISHRSIPVPDKKRLESRYRRWKKISHEALKQCGRSRAMDIFPMVSFDAMLKQADSCDLKLVFWEKERRGLSSIQKRQGKPKRIFMVLGPEGGFEPSEIASAQKDGFQAVGLGPRILRAETASLAACALVQFVFGDMGQNFLDNPEAV